ncbi:hypothetical protein WA026_012051 [Henosepilachna vigintioctopunctata]|uniref:Uncharacterized protein n=1 Tax=Henosepilachna vigintioctopunctata TaxID=420089 RepID=A0AAW1VE26_9CUCU
MDCFKCEILLLLVLVCSVYNEDIQSDYHEVLSPNAFEETRENNLLLPIPVTSDDIYSILSSKESIQEVVGIEEIALLFSPAKICPDCFLKQKRLYLFVVEILESSRKHLRNLSSC